MQLFDNQRRFVNRGTCALLLFCLTSGCAWKTSVTHLSTPAQLGNGSVFIAVPQDGQFEGKPYTGSGRETSLALAKAAKSHFQRVDLGSAGEPDGSVLQSAKALQDDFAIIPNIVHWEDRATEWSGRPDRVEVELRIYDVQKRKQIDVVDLKAKSGVFTPMGHSPGDLLPALFEEFFTGKRPPPSQKATSPKA